MIYQSNVKDEPFSPYAPNDTFATTDSRTASRAMSSADSPAECPRSDSEEMQASAPETKKRLQSVVLGRRKAKGYTDIPSNLFEEPTVCKLTQADIDKREKRKAQNRMAAMKCRAKKKTQQDKAAQEKVKYAETNEQMQKLVYSMLRTLNVVMACLSQHLCCGDCRVSAEAQHEHHQVISQTEKFLQSLTKICTQREEEPQQSCHVAEDFGEDDTCRLTTNHSSDTNNDVGMYSTPGNAVMVTKGLHSTISESLPSWDLENINADIPFNALSHMDLSESLVRAEGASQSVGFTDGNSQNHFSEVLSQCHYLPILTDDGFTHGSATGTEMMYLENGISGNIHEREGISVFRLPRSSDRTDSVSMCGEFTDAETSLVCVSPNLVQPNPASASSCPTTTQGGVYSYNQNRNNENGNNEMRLGELCLVIGDVNNNNNDNRSKHLPGKTGEHNSVQLADLTRSNTLPLNHPNMSYSNFSTYFTFDHDHSSPEAMETSGSEPISPFYTQGANRRM